MRRIKVYDAYDYDAYLGRGTTKEIMALTGFARSTVQNFARLGHKRYGIIHIGYRVPVYALYDNDQYVDSGTIEHLANKVDMAAENLNFRRFKSAKQSRNFRYNVYKIEGEYEVSIIQREIKIVQKIYEIIRDGELHQGTTKELMDKFKISSSGVLNNSRHIGTRHAEVTAINHETLEERTGTIEEISSWTLLSETRIIFVIKRSEKTKYYKVFHTGKFIDEYIWMKKPVESVIKSTVRKPQRTPVTPMSDYAKSLLEQTTRHLREYQR